MEYTREIRDGWQLYEVHGEISFSQIDVLDLLCKDIKNALKLGEYRFIFDFKHVPFIDSSGIAVVILAMSSAMKNKTPIKVCGLNENTQKSFEMIRMNFGVRYYDSVEQALKDN
jgi:anti-anti-sigma factor